MKTIQRETTILYITLAAVAYFILLAILSYYPIETTSIGVIGEMITIPLLLFVIFSFGYSLYNIIKKPRNKTIISIFILSLISIAFLVIITTIQMR